MIQPVNRGYRSRGGEAHLRDDPPARSLAGPGITCCVLSPLEAKRARDREQKRASRARLYVPPAPRNCLFCTRLIPASLPSKRGARPKFCSESHRVAFDRRAARIRRLTESLARGRRRLEAIDTALLDLLAAGKATSAAVVDFAIESGQIASGRNQVYLGALAALEPAATRYNRGGRPRKIKEDPRA